MSNLKMLVVTFCLMSVLAISALGQTPSPPCPPPDPGEMQGPPCSTAQLTTDDPTNPGETPAPPAAEAVVITTIADAAVGALLSLF